MLECHLSRCPGIYEATCLISTLWKTHPLCLALIPCKRQRFSSHFNSLAKQKQVGIFQWYSTVYIRQISIFLFLFPIVMYKSAPQYCFETWKISNWSFNCHENKKPGREFGKLFSGRYVQENTDFCGRYTILVTCASQRTLDCKSSRQQNQPKICL